MTRTQTGENITIARPDDWHVHLRDDELLQAVVPHTAALFRYALVMPNLQPPITSTSQAAAYRRRILDCVGLNSNSEFTPLMTLYLNDQLSTHDLRAGLANGVVHAVKYYPAGATTNSDEGGVSLFDYMKQLELMAEVGAPLLVHAESIDESIDIFDRERAFLDKELQALCNELPELKVTVEHVSTADGVAFVREHVGVAGTITPHHLTRDRSDLLANGLDPHLYCKPIINSARDRDALVAAAISGEASFFLGTDSAPHPTSHKHAARARAGIFNAPFALQIIAELFHSETALDKLEGFTSIHGACHYGFEPSKQKVTMSRLDNPTDKKGESIRTNQGNEVIVFGAELGRRWSINQQGGDN